MPAFLANDAVIALGSNIEPKAHVERAIAAIAREHRVLARSKFAWTKPIGKPNQPDFLNGAIRVETSMDLDELRAWLRKVEGRLGRARTADKFGPRTIDLDVVAWNGQVIHDDFHSRDFVRAAVLEVCPEAR